MGEVTWTVQVLNRGSGSPFIVLQIAYPDGYRRRASGELKTGQTAKAWVKEELEASEKGHALAVELGRSETGTPPAFNSGQ